MMATTHHPRTRRQVDRLFSRGLPSADHRDLWGHLRDCGDFRGYYERLRHLEEAADPDDVLSQVAIERLSDLVVPPKAARASSPRFLGFFATAAAGLAAVALLAVALPEGFFESEYLGTRGGETGAPTVALTLFRIDPDSAQVERLTSGPVASPIRAGDVVQMAYRSEHQTRAVVVGIDARGDLQWYHPGATDRAAGAVTINPRAVDEPFGGAWRITAPPGPLRLFAVFGDDTLDVGVVERALEGLPRDAGAVREMTRLPGVGSTQASRLLEVQP